jgi:hypothetical protein
MFPSGPYIGPYSQSLIRLFSPHFTSVRSILILLCHLCLGPRCLLHSRISTLTSILNNTDIRTTRYYCKGLKCLCRIARIYGKLHPLSIKFWDWFNILTYVNVAQFQLPRASIWTFCDSPEVFMLVPRPPLGGRTRRKSPCPLPVAIFAVRRMDVRFEQRLKISR